MGQQLFATSSLGGYLHFNRLSKQIRDQSGPEYVFRQFCDIKEGGKNKGDYIYFNKMLRIDTRGGTLAETATVPANLVKVIQGSVQMTEYGNGVQYTGKLEALSEWDPSNIYQRFLRDDSKDTLDRAAAAQFVAADFKAVVTNTSTVIFTTNSIATATQNADISDKNHRAIVDYMRLKYIPTYGKGDYVAILSINAMSGLYTYLQAMAQYTTPVNQFNFEKGSYYGCRMVVDNNYLANTLGTGAAFGEAVYFGEETVVEALGVPEEIRMDTPKDLGRDLKLGWYAIAGYAKMWDLSTDDLNSTGKGIERIIHVTSA